MIYGDNPENKTPDSSAITQSGNLYVYCGNNPVLREDDSGHFWHIVAGALLGGAGKVVDMCINGELDLKDWRTYAKIGVAAASGGLTAAAGPIAGTLISGAASGIDSALSGNDFEQVITDTACGIITAGVITGIGSAVQLIPGVVSAKHFVDNASKTQLKQFANSLGYVGRNYKQASAWGGKIMVDAAQEFTDTIPAKIIGDTVTWGLDRVASMN